MERIHRNRTSNRYIVGKLFIWKLVTLPNAALSHSRYDFFFFRFRCFIVGLRVKKIFHNQAGGSQPLSSEPIKNSNPPGAHIVHDIKPLSTNPDIQQNMQPQ